MKRLLTPLVGAALSLLLFSGTSARADTFWSYDWSGPGSSTSVISDSGNSMIHFYNQTLSVGANSSDILASNLSEAFIHPVAHDNYTNQNYNLSLTLTDLASTDSVVMNFSGKLTGFIGPLSSHITNAFNPPTTQDAWLGGNHYFVTIGPYTPPGPPGSYYGAIGASVEVIPGERHDSPEPSTILLSGLGFSFIGFFSMRRKLVI